MTTPRSLLKLVALSLCAVLGVSALTALGVWQVERRTWKLDLIERVDRRVHAPPVAAPGPADWPLVNAADAEYRPVRVTGHFLNDSETLVQAVTDRGAGFWVMVPFQTGAGFTVLVNRGFVPSAQRDRPARAAGEITGDTTVTGLLRITEPKGGFLRSNDPAAGRWYSRDVAAIAAARGLPHVAPYFIDADATPNPGGLPIGGLTIIAFPNNHLVYALTWFGLALMLAGWVVVVAREEWRLRRPTVAAGRATSDGLAGGGPVREQKPAAHVSLPHMSARDPRGSLDERNWDERNWRLAAPYRDRNEPC